MTRGPSFQWALAAACVMLLLAHWGGLFYWSWQVTVHSFDLGVFSRFCVWLGASSFSHPPRKKNQVCHISLKTLQCYSGKVISLSLAILGCKLYVPEVFKSTSCHSGSSQGRNSSLETQGQSVGLGEKAGRKFSSTDKRAPGYQLSQNYFQEFRQMPAPDWAQKMLCIIVPNRRRVSLFVSSYTTAIFSPHLLGSFTKLLRERETFTFYFPNLPETKELPMSRKNVWDAISRSNWIWPEYSVFHGSQCIVNNRKFKIRRRQKVK